MKFLILLLAVMLPTTNHPRAEENTNSRSPNSKAAAREALAGKPDYSAIDMASAYPKELPSWRIPNMPESVEAYYAPDNYHVIAQVLDRKSQTRPGYRPKTWIYTDDGANKWMLNGKGNDACSFFFPDGKKVAFTSTRDLPELPEGNWSKEDDYPSGAELYVANLDGKILKRLTNNRHYDAEVSISPDGQKLVFTRQIDGALDLYVINADGTDERRLTDTADWQEGGAFFLPDSRTVITRAWKRDGPKSRSRPMTIWTIDVETGERFQQTFDDKMNWAPFPAPDGKHYVFVRPLEDDPRNWEIYLGSFGSPEVVRLTYHDGFDGFPSISPDGKKMLFSRSAGAGPMRALHTHVMDISSLNIRPRLSP